MKTKYLSQKNKVYISLLVVSIFLIASNPIFSQDIGDLVRLKVQIPVLSVKSIIQGNNPGKTLEVIGGSTKFMVISKTDSKVQLQAPNYKKRTQSYITNYIKENSEPPLDLSEFYNEKIYTVSKSDFDLSAVAITEKKRISVGLLTLPFKARPQDSFSFDTEFNINTTMNIALNYYGDYSLNFQFGAGIGSVGLNTNNSEGLMEDQNQDVSTLTFLSGIMLAHKNLQVGLYAGVDQINNQENYRWKSNGNVWFAFGIGYDLFNVATANTINKQDN